MLPTARIVGILRRNWRQYCGIVLPSNIPGGRQYLFAPTERLIPRIRIETSHYEQLKNKKVLVQIDNWPQGFNIFNNQFNIEIFVQIHIIRRATMFE